MNFTPRIETREISDSDLDSVSGGLGISGGATLTPQGGEIQGSIDGPTGPVGIALPTPGMLNQSS